MIEPPTRSLDFCRKIYNFKQNIYSRKSYVLGISLVRQAKEEVRLFQLMADALVLALSKERACWSSPRVERRWDSRDGNASCEGKA